METQVGIIKKVRWESPNSDWKVIELKRRDRSTIAVTGDFPVVFPGAKLEVHGKFESHHKYGVTFKSSAHTHGYDKTNTSSVCLYIQSIAKWVGPERSRQIAEKFGDEIEEIIEKTPEKLTEIEGIGPKIAQSIADAWILNREMKTVRIFLHSLGLSESKIKRIITRYGGRTEDLLKENPWILQSEGFGFTTCDHIAQKLGLDMRCANRFIHFALYVFRTAMNGGHLYLIPSQIVESFNKFNMQTPYPLQDREITLQDLAPHLKKLIEDYRIINDRNMIYLLDNYYYETESARMLAKISADQTMTRLSSVDVESYIGQYEKDHRINLSDRQKDAVRSFVKEKVMIITGNPGTGKCLGWGTKVLMFDGTIKEVQDIRVGDTLMGDDSLPRKVLSITNGKETMYRVCQKSAEDYVVNESHILCLKDINNTDSDREEAYDIAVREYLNCDDKKILKGYRVPVNFPSKKVPSDPYILGLWIGSRSKSYPRAPVTYREIDELFSKFRIKIGRNIIDSSNVIDPGMSWRQSSEVYRMLLDKRTPNHLLNYLRLSGLDTGDHIPLQYRVNDRRNRMALLSGILDSSGAQYKNSRGYEICIRGERIAEDIIFVVRSLGLTAAVEPYRGFFRRKDRDNEKQYRVWISGEDLDQIPMIVKRRKIVSKSPGARSLLSDIEVQNIGMGRYYGFQIDGNGRFLLGDFTVTHNTTLVKALVQMMKPLGISFELLTPTGIAAKRLADTSGCEAATIHRKLQYRGKNEWIYNSLNKYKTDVVLIDETSMVDQEVFYRLLSAMYSSTRFVFVGDYDQLPSVGPGNVLRDLISCKKFKTIFLDTIFRQEECSEIILEAKKIRDGNTDMEYIRSDKHADIWMIEENDPQKIESTIVNFSKQLKDRAKADTGMHFQIITPRNGGPASVDSLNEVLQKELNPEDKSRKPEIKVNGTIIRKGDRVRICRNNYELSVYNGDIGKVSFITKDNISIDLEGYGSTTRRVEIPIRESEDMIALSYAITVHRSQGTEYPLVIMPFLKAHGKFLLQRNLLYTALTRAKKKCIILGQRSAIESAIGNNRMQKRNTVFNERICEWITGSAVSLRDVLSQSNTAQASAALRRLSWLEGSTSSEPLPPEVQEEE